MQVNFYSFDERMQYERTSWYLPQVLASRAVKENNKTRIVERVP